MSRVSNADRAQIGSRQLAEIFQATVTLTNAQIKALPTTPITLVAAPGSGLLLLPLSALLFAKTASGAYTNIDAAAWLTVDVAGTNLSLATVPNDASITNASATRLTDLLGGAAANVVHLAAYTDTEGVDFWGPISTVLTTSAVTNAALAIAINNNGSGVLTGGHAANTLTAFVTYMIVTVP